MKFSAAAIVGALAAIVNAKAVITNSAFDVQVGEPFTLNWTNATGSVEVQLVTGPSTNLVNVGSPLATGVSGSSFTWTPPTTLASGTYAFKVTDSTGEPNYSLQFSFQGSASASVSSSTASSTASSSTTAKSSTVTSSSSSASSTSSVASNTTTTATTATKSTSTTSSTSKATTTPANSNDSQRFASPLALVLVTVAALICFN